MRYAVNLPEQRERRYWLIDTASLPEGEVLRRFYSVVDQPMFRWLYDGTAYHGVRESGPVLLDITHNAKVWQQCSADWMPYAASVVIDTPASLDDLQQRLAACLTIDTSGSGMGLLRFHEPAVLHLLLGEEQLDQTDRLVLMGEDTCWSWPLCLSQENIVHERYFSAGGNNWPDGKPLRLAPETQQRLQGLRQFSRLMPLLGDAVHRFDLLQKEDDCITSLWWALEHYWHDTWQLNLSRKQAVENAQGKLIASDAFEHFIESLSLDAMT
ncbi:DUF4123 domain-containing protein [Halomonas sp. 5021]|jgi:hypothetical protein|uniref:DUF4123 domain-containing protein n=1 Tax=unclassified Halomonas TaxID=2609666 RepID=UPI0018F03C9E|nr:DUF4123 domain-containing protein [Halomonas sp. A40-4]QPL47584.1 DUF4123 domain-containing protein [Halomonas sp. A40-4]